MTDTLDLKPCPLCEGLPAKYSAGGSDERNGYAITMTIRCQSCGLEISRTGDLSKGGYADNSRVEGDVVSAWNRRALAPKETSK